MTGVDLTRIGNQEVRGPKHGSESNKCHIYRPVVF